MNNHIGSDFDEYLVENALRTVAEDEPASPLSTFFRKATEEEKRRVYEAAAKAANIMQLRLLEEAKNGGAE